MEYHNGILNEARFNQYFKFKQTKPYLYNPKKIEAALGQSECSLNNQAARLAYFLVSKIAEHTVEGLHVDEVGI